MKEGEEIAKFFGIVLFVRVFDYYDAGTWDFSSDWNGKSETSVPYW